MSNIFEKLDNTPEDEMYRKLIRPTFDELFNELQSYTETIKRITTHDEFVSVLKSKGWTLDEYLKVE